MNKKQLSEHIGNIDDRLVQQAEKIPNYAAQRRRRRMRQFLTVAAALLLMVSSFSAGAMVFAREIIIEVPAEQETLELEGIDLTLILPDSWKGQYSVEKNGANYVVYNPQIKEAVSDGTEILDGGVLFTIVCYEEAMTEEQFIENGLDFTPYRYLLAANNKTYILHYASDVQYDPANQEQKDTYQKMMSEIEDIQIVVNNLFPPKDFHVSEGTDWDSAQEEHYFYQMGGQGTYHVVLRYFLEAAEGNGIRFHAMLDTFTSVTAQDKPQTIPN